MNKEILNLKLNRMYHTDGTISNILGMFSQSELDIIDNGILENLRHHSIGLWNTVSGIVPSQIQGGGTLTIRTQPEAVVDNYTVENRRKPGDIHSMGVITLNPYRNYAVKFEIETLELNGMNFTTRAQYMSFIQNGITARLAAFFDAHYLDVAVRYVKDNITKFKAAARKRLQILELGENAENLAIDKMDEITKKGRFWHLALSQTHTNLQRQFNNKDLGSRAKDIATIMYKNITDIILNTMPTSGDSRTQISRVMSGEEGRTQISGLGIVQDHLFLNQKVESGILHKEDNFDFTGIYGIMAHREAILLAHSPMLTTQNVNPESGNPITITKFTLWRGMIRDYLFALIVDKLDNVKGSNLTDLKDVKKSSNNFEKNEVINDKIYKHLKEQIDKLNPEPENKEQANNKEPENQK